MNQSLFRKLVVQALQVFHGTGGRHGGADDEINGFLRSGPPHSRSGSSSCLLRTAGRRFRWIHRRYRCCRRLPAHGFPHWPRHPCPGSRPAEPNFMLLVPLASLGGQGYLFRDIAGRNQLFSQAYIVVIYHDHSAMALRPVAVNDLTEAEYHGWMISFAMV